MNEKSVIHADEAPQKVKALLIHSFYFCQHIQQGWIAGFDSFFQNVQEFKEFIDIRQLAQNLNQA